MSKYDVCKTDTGYLCPCCPRRTFKSARALQLHMNKQHQAFIEDGELRYKDETPVSYKPVTRQPIQEPTRGLEYIRAFTREGMTHYELR